MSGGTTQQSGTSTSVNQIPAWMSDAGQQNYAYAQQVAEQPLQQYQGQMVADVAPQTQQSWDVAANSGNVGADQYAAGSLGYLGALAQNLMQASAGGPTMQVNNPGNAAAVTAGQLSNTERESLSRPVHSGRNQRDHAWDDPGQCAVAKPGSERGELRQCFRRFAARNSARGSRKRKGLRTSA